MNARSLQLGALSLLATAAVLVVFGVGGPWLRVPLGLLVVLVLPGYAAVRMADPSRRLDTTQRAALTLGLSIAFVVVAGVVLHFLSLGLTTTTWVVALSVITAVALALAYMRERDGREQEQRTERVRPRTRDLLALGAAVGIVAVVLGVSVQQGVLRDRGDDVVQLWILPKTGDTGTVQVGVRNLTDTPEHFILQVRQGATTVSDVRDLQLGSRQTGEMYFSLPATAARERITATLYRAEAPGRPFRSVWLHSSDATTPASSPTG